MLDPCTELKNKIAQIRKSFNEEYKIGQGVGSKVNIALARFKQLEMLENRIVGHVNKIAMGYPPVKVELKDHGIFPSPTIFINVVSKIPVQNLSKEVRNELPKDNESHVQI